MYAATIMRCTTKKQLLITDIRINLKRQKQKRPCGYFGIAAGYESSAEMPAYQPVAELLCEQPEVFGLVAHAARNDGRMYAQFLCQDFNILGLVAAAGGGFFPGRLRDKGFARHGIRFALDAVLVIGAIQIVGKQRVGFVQMFGDVSQLVKQHKPEIIQPVVTQG
jgi:hypothetical protein